MSISSKIQSLITAANTVTGKSRTDLTSAVQDLKDGYGGGNLDFEGSSTLVKSVIVTIGANNCTTMLECGAYIASLCGLNEWRLAVVAIEKKDSYINRECGCIVGKIASPYTATFSGEYMRYANGHWTQTTYSGAYDGFLVEGTKYLVVLTKGA